MGSTTQYDTIARDYEKSENSRGTRYLFDPSVKRVIGDVAGLSILDFGCGHGYTARQLKESGASKVVGFDISQGQIDLAREIENHNPAGISYYVYDATEAPVLGDFNIAMAKFVLHYSESRKQLVKMFEGAFRNLKDGGRLVALVPDFSNPLRSDPKYDYTSSADGEVNEGDEVEITLYLEGEELCRFKNRHWKKSTYEACAREAGFREISWHPVLPSEEGIERFGADFFQDFLDAPNHTILEAIK